MQPNVLKQAYDGLLGGLAIVAGAIMAALFVVIITDVSMRTSGARPPNFTLSATEYGLLYMTTLGAPWLLRRGGHVSVNTFVDRLPARARFLLLRVVHLLAAVTCAIVAYYAFKVASTITGIDIRSVPVPRWVVLVTMPLSFALLAVEFVRIALTGNFDRGESGH